MYVCVCPYCCQCGDIVYFAEHTATSTDTPKKINILFFFKSQRGLGKSSDNILPCRNSPSQQGFETHPRLSINTAGVCVWWWGASYLWPGSPFPKVVLSLALFSVFMPVFLCRTQSIQECFSVRWSAYCLSTDGLNFQETCFHRHGS